MAHIRGLDRWERWIEDIPEEVEQEVKTLVAETSYKIEADAKLLAPVSTGHLRRSIKTKISKAGYTATIGTNVEYSNYVEFGTSKMDAQPFLIPAYVKHKDDFKEELKDILDKVGD